MVTSFRSKFGAAALTAAMLTMPFAALVTPMTANAAGAYSISLSSGYPLVTGPFAISLAGTASAGHYIGQLSAQNVAVTSWGDGSSTIPATFNMTSSDTSSNTFSGNWSASHTYTAGGTYTITVEVYHGQPTGQDGTDLSTILVQAVVPPATLKVIKHVVNTDPSHTKTPADFILHVTGTGVGTPDPATLQGSDTGTVVSLFPGISGGTFSVTEDPVTGYTQTSAVGCSGSVFSGNQLTCTITNTDVVNHPPVLTSIPDQTVNELTLLTVNTAASDPDGDTLSYSLGSAPAGASINASTGVFAWTPTEAQGPGNYTATVVVSDGKGGTDSKTFNIHVNEVNVPPHAADETVSTHINTPKVITLSATDSDIPVQSLSYTIVTPPVNGSLSLIVGNQVTYTPAPNATSTESFTYKANDGVADSDNNATVTITVNDDAPTLSQIVNKVIDELAPLNFTLVASDPSNDTLSYSLTGPVPAGASVDSSSGVFSWTPTEAQGPGIYNFFAQVSDGVLTDSQPVQVTVNEVNIPPTADAQTVTTAENVPIAIALTGSDTDIPSQLPLSFGIATQPTHGTVTLVGAVATYTPTLNSTSTDSFTFTSNDGLASSAPATVTVNVTNTPENTLTLCTDGIDNDNDGLIDLADPDCAAFIPQLTTNFVLVNDNGGTAVATDFGLTLDTASTSSGVLGTTTVGAHTVAATGPSGYTISYSGDCDTSGTVTLAAGDNKVCTVTADDNAPAPVTPPSNGGGGGGGGGGIINGPLSVGFTNGGGVVLGTSTEATADCPMYLTGYMRPGAANNSGEVTKLQWFLDNIENMSVPQTGTYDTTTIAAVNTFQTKYASDVLSPWGATGPTSYVYYTTRRQVNRIYCKFTNDFPLDGDQQAEIARFKAAGEAYNPGQVLGASTGPANTGSAPASTGTTGAISGTTNVPATTGTATAPTAAASFWGKVFNWLFHR